MILSLDGLVVLFTFLFNNIHVYFHVSLFRLLCKVLLFFNIQYTRSLKEGIGIIYEIIERNKNGILGTKFVHMIIILNVSKFNTGEIVPDIIGNTKKKGKKGKKRWTYFLTWVGHYSRWFKL